MTYELLFAAGLTRWADVLGEPFKLVARLGRSPRHQVVGITGVQEGHVVPSPAADMLLAEASSRRCHGRCQEH